MMLKETLLFILLECLICMAQNGPPMGPMQLITIDSNSQQYEQFTGDPAPADHQQKCDQFMGAPASVEYEQQYDQFIGAPASAKYEQQYDQFIGAPTPVTYEQQYNQFIGVPAQVKYEQQYDQFIDAPALAEYERQYVQFIGARAPAKYEQRYDQFIGAPASAQYEQQNNHFIGAQAPAKYEQQYDQFFGAPASAEYEQQYDQFIGTRAPTKYDQFVGATASVKYEQRYDQLISAPAPAEQQYNENYFGAHEPQTPDMRSQALNGLAETIVNVVLGKDAAYPFEEVQTAVIDEKYQKMATGYSKFKELFFPQLTEWTKLQLKLKDTANKYIQAYDQSQSLYNKFVLSRLPSDRAAFGTAATLLVSQGNAYDAIALEEETMQNQIRNQIEAFMDTFIPFEKLISDMWKIVEGWPQPTYSI